MKCLFKKKPTDHTTPKLPPKPKPTTPSVPQGSPRKKVAVIVGHTKNSPGATNYKDDSEYPFNSRIAAKVQNIMRSKYANEIEFKVFYRDGIGRKGVAEQVSEWGADVCLELHYNSYKKIAYGCEILIAGDYNLKMNFRAADIFTDVLAEEFGLRERAEDGVKVLRRGDRGYQNLDYINDHRVVQITLLIEPCFANIKTAESAAIFENEDKYARVISEQLYSIATKIAA